MTAITTQRSSTELATAFANEARRLAEEFEIPGASMALMLPDGDHFVNVGVTSFDNPLDVDSDTIFQIGSNTKTLTSLTVSALEEQGKLKVTDRVRDHLPDFKMKDESVADSLTLLDVLTHQGGFQGDVFTDTGAGDDALAKMVEAMAELPQVMPMRTHWSYSNSGFYIAGRVIEVASGMTYEAAVTELVLKPLGMDHTLFFASEVMTYRFATGYNNVGDELVAQRPWLMTRSAGPAGSTCCSTARDMVRYARYVMSGTLASIAEADGETNEQPPLATLDRARLWKPVRDIGAGINSFPGKQAQMGQSWFIDQHPDALILSHGGSTLGHQSNMWLSPDRKVGFLSLTNAPNGHAMNRKLSDWVKREVLGLSAPPLPEFSVSDEELGRLVGYFIVNGQPYNLGTKLENGQLFVVMPGSGAGGTTDLPLRFIAPDLAVVVGGDVDGTNVEFVREDGEVAFMRLGARLFPAERPEGASAGLPMEAL
ncbi:serine hydrolase domain-containing protein [Deinococcus marmoris]|uniref:Beta-lactamase n=1 Tax=Deinococcus marmoris TaxID=249408 RepID=A0A1U7P5A8_9DEIO|nr:serine hydrolase domain-containing protein [Deinococcus marmoris]OLV20338.1 Beta-lactamase [Deinococcus marmoris]